MNKVFVENNKNLIRNYNQILEELTKFDLYLKQGAEALPETLKDKIAVYLVIVDHYRGCVLSVCEHLDDFNKQIKLKPDNDKILLQKTNDTKRAMMLSFEWKALCDFWAEQMREALRKQKGPVKVPLN
jgi:hypothetical protein